MFRKILIANRGEIACRIIRTARKLGINTVSLYSNIDLDSKHASMADSAYYLGGNKSSESYLNMKKIIEIAKQSGSEAIHPGYGFLSENCDFVKLCEDNNIKFIGPPSSAIRAMGSKIESKKIMEAAKVPVVPGYFGDNQEKGFLLQTANRVGYPILIKADLGGGGKGMRIVRNEREFEEALLSAQTEAAKSFGSAKILMERYLESSRHIEVQVFGDHHGNYVHLFERDCTIQRRHQKVIEEAPSYLDEVQRQKLCLAAVEAAKAVGYANAGTVEFIYDIPSKEFFFMEMNTRLQVEHPISEMITGQDFVEWQLLVASGSKLPLKQDQIKINGHAIEARIYSEDPKNNFLPGSGKILYMSEPANRYSETNYDEDVRIETGIRSGDEVSVFYDPMISKLVCWSKNRDLCIKKVLGALENYKIVGLPTNIKFVKSILENDTFQSWDFDTNFIAKHYDTLTKEKEGELEMDILSTILSKIAHEKQQNLKKKSPWDIQDNFRVNYRESRVFPLTVDGKKINVKAVYLNENTFNLKIQGLERATDEVIFNEVVIEPIDSNTLKIILKNNCILKIKYYVDDYGNIKVLKGDGTITNFDFTPEDFGISDDLHETGRNSVKSPMPSTVSKIFVNVGSAVEKGDKIISLEAMKMEHVLKAPKKTIIKNIYVKEAQFVKANTTLIDFEDDLNEK